MGSVSQFIKNGANLSLTAGSSAIATGDLLEIGGPGNEAWSVATTDYAAIGAVGALVSQTSIVSAAIPGSSRIQIARDKLGNTYIAGTNSSGNLVIYKNGPLVATRASSILDSIATNINTPKLFQLQSGNFACVYSRAAGALYFVIFDANLSNITNPTLIATEYAATNIVYHDAFALNGGGFAVFYQTSTGTSINLATFSNIGAVVLAPVNVQTLAGTASQEFLRGGQLSNNNLVIGYRGAMTAGGTTGTSFTIVNVSGINQAGSTNIDNNSVAGFLEYSSFTGYFALADANGTNLKASVYSNVGTLQGSQYSVTNTLNSIVYPQVKLCNDGVQFFLVFQTSVNNGINVVQMPIAGATTGIAVAALGSATLSVNTYALDAEIVNGLLVVLLASSTTSGQYWMTIGLPDASLGIAVPYVRTAPTVFGTTASTTGSNWLRVMSGGGGLYQGTNPPIGQPTNPPTNGDFTAIFAYDQQNTIATFIGIQKIEASSIIGLSTSYAITGGNPGTPLPSVNPGPGEYTVNAIAGTTGKSFNHTTGITVGSSGTLYNSGVQLGLQQNGSGSSLSAGIITSVSGGFQPSGVFGTGRVMFFSASTSFVPSISPVRVRVFGGGGNALGTGGTSSFGSYCSATGGTATAGIGIGGDINYTGGNGVTSQGGGGGGSANYFGNGGNGGAPGAQGPSGGGGNGPISTISYPGGNGISGTAGIPGTATLAPVSPISISALQFSLDLIGTGPGGNGGNTLPSPATSGVNGGGGGGNANSAITGSGGFPGGGSGGQSVYAGVCGGNGAGFSMKVCAVAIGIPIAVTVGNGSFTSASYGCSAGGGLVIVEY